MPHNDLTRCPRCGERVTAFAAGCSTCGADLDITRFRRRNAQAPVAQAKAAGGAAADTLRGWVRRATSR